MFEIVMLLAFTYVGLIHLLPDPGKSEGGRKEFSGHAQGQASEKGCGARNRAPHFSPGKSTEMKPFASASLRRPSQRRADVLPSGRFLQGGAADALTTVLGRTAPKRRSI